MTKSSTNKSKNTQKGSILHDAIHKNNLELLKVLLKRNNTLLDTTNADGDTPFLYALKLDKTDGFSICKILLEKDGVNIYSMNNNEHNALVIAAVRNEPKLIQMLREKEKTSSSNRSLLREGLVEAIKQAVSKKCLGVIQPLLEVEEASDYLDEFETELRTIANFTRNSHDSSASRLNQYLEENFGESCDLSSEEELTPYSTNSFCRPA